MILASIKNNFFKYVLLLGFMFFINCKHAPNNEYSINKSQVIKADIYNLDKMPIPELDKPIYMEITLDSIVTEKEYPQYIDEWNNYKFDYYYLKLNLVDYGSYLFKIHLIGYRMPIIFQFGKNIDETIYLNEIQQLNTTWQDSIVFKKDINGKYNPFKAYQIGFYHNGTDEICPLDISNNKDTIDITNLNSKEKCFQRKRGEVK